MMGMGMILTMKTMMKILMMTEGEFSDIFVVFFVGKERAKWWSCILSLLYPL